MKLTIEQKQRIGKNSAYELPKINSYVKNQRNLQEYIDMVKKPMERYETFESKINNQ